MNNENIRPKEEMYQMAIKKHLPGLVTLQECDICGYLDWSSTASREPDGYRIEPRHGGCRKCDEAAMRAPELAQWVMNVVIKAQRDLTPNVLVCGGQAQTLALARR